MFLMYFFFHAEMNHIETTDFAILNSDLSNRHPLINRSQSLAEHLYDSIQSFILNRSSKKIVGIEGPKKDQTEHKQQVPRYSDMLLSFTEFHETAAKLLLKRINEATSDEYILVGRKYSDDYIALYFNLRYWRATKKP